MIDIVSHLLLWGSFFLLGLVIGFTLTAILIRAAKLRF